jgi:hypothetical protein
MNDIIYNARRGSLTVFIGTVHHVASMVLWELRSARSDATFTIDDGSVTVDQLIWEDDRVVRTRFGHDMFHHDNASKEWKEAIGKIPDCDPPEISSHYKK